MKQTAALLCLLSYSGLVYADEPRPVLILPVKVHLVQSHTYPNLHAKYVEADVLPVFFEVNRIWSQAGIRFELKNMGTLQALEVAPKKWLQRDRDWVKSALPQAHLSATAIDVCFVRQMGPNGFFYGEPVVVSETPTFTKVKGGSENAVARVVAHELGHVLWLKHRENHTNLMASGRNGVSLNNQEIKDARQRAMEIIGKEPVAAP